jgi:hypothetical protein
VDGSGYEALELLTNVGGKRAIVVRTGSERSGVERAVMGYLEARGDLRPCAELCGSYLSTFEERREKVLPRMGLRDARSIVESIDVTHVGDGVAVAGVTATHYRFGDMPLGPRHDAEIFRGPWLLHRLGGTWKTTAFTVAGRSTLDSVHVEATGRSEADGVVAEVVQVNSKVDSTVLLLSVQNLRDEVVEFRTIAVSNRLRLGRGTIEDGIPVEPGGAIVAHAAVGARFALRTEELRVKIGAKAERTGKVRLPAIEVILGRPGRRILRDEGLEVPRGV